MVYLVIDVGNSSTSWALGDPNTLHILDSWRTETITSHTITNYTVLCSQYIQDHVIEAVIIASVVPSVNGALQAYCASISQQVTFIDASLLTLTIDLPNSEEIGADRLIDAYAAWKLYQADCIIVDFGTATTCELVTAEGVYKGGTISPGIDLSLKALHMGTAQLPHISFQKPKNVIGTSTIGAIESGMFWGYVGLVEGLITRIEQEYGKKCSLIATGGHAPLFADVMPMIDNVDVDLTVKGLLLAARG